jgi:hypothetical protein
LASEPEPEPDPELRLGRWRRLLRLGRWLPELALPEAGVAGPKGRPVTKGARARMVAPVAPTIFPSRASSSVRRCRTPAMSYLGIRAKVTGACAAAAPGYCVFQDCHHRCIRLRAPDWSW